MLIFGLIILYSCKDNELGIPLDGSPEMPPVATMQLNFDSFPTDSSLPKAGGNQSIETPGNRANWGWAHFNGIFWQSLVTVGMVIPVAAFVESFNHDPEQLEDGTWVWSYEFTPLGGVKHTASLHADVSNLGVLWEMYISKTDHFTDFLWFSGQSDLFATEGTWTINHQPGNPEDSTANIKYTNIIPNHDENGGYIYYGIQNDSLYDAFYNIYNKGKDNLTSIQWNRNTYEGRVRDSLHFGDYEWHCWDSNLVDIECP